MARLGSRMIAGYYPTPPHLVPSLASLLAWPDSRGAPLVLCDPCAGDGAALSALADCWSPVPSVPRCRMVACEMEAGRAAALAARFSGYQDVTFDGDAFSLVKRSPDAFGASVLFLNPPYDTDDEYARLEHRFLNRFSSWVAPGCGWLYFVVPAGTLAVSAHHLARHFDCLSVYRFPDRDFERFGQVVVLGRRRDEARDDADPVALAVLESAAAEPNAIAELPCRSDSPAEGEVPWSNPYSLVCELLPFDPVTTLAHVRPFAECGFGELNAGALFDATYRTAAPPRAAHIAMALSAGIFNGQRLEADEPGRFPPLLVKGVFEREWLRVKETRGEDGDFKSAVEIERPKLRLTILRLDSYTYLTLGPGTVPTRSDDLAEWNAADLLMRYGKSLAAELYRRFSTLHDPRETGSHIALPDLPRKPYRVQAHAIQTALKLLAEGRNPFFVAEVGTGKTTMALSTVACLSPEHCGATAAELARVTGQPCAVSPVRRTLVVCPPHLLDTWVEEAAAVLPEARVVVVDAASDFVLDAELYILSRERAKLGHAWRGVEHACPGCGAPLLTGSASSRASRRLRCKARRQRPANAAARHLVTLGTLLLPFDPESTSLARLPLGAALRRLAVESEPADVAALPLAALREVGCELRAESSGPWAVRSAGETISRALGAAPERRLELVLEALRQLSSVAFWHDEGPCDTPLFQAVPEPRRYPLAQAIQRWYRHRFDLLILDEAHEFAHRSSAQSRAAHRLSGLPGVPTLVLTGSLMGGYASSLFANHWALSRDFQREFEHSAVSRFVDRYGFRKILIQRKSNAGRRGAVTDRDTTEVRNLGEAPGVLPTFVLRHLLPTAVTVHKDDLDEALPPLAEEPVAVPIPEDDDNAQALVEEYRRLERRLLSQIRSDLKDPELRGRLLGALVELPSYLDRATDDQPPLEIRYPESVGGDLLDCGKSFPAAWLSPKERWFVDELRSRLDAGENVLVFLRHTGKRHLPNRLLDLICSHVTAQVDWLDASRVTTAKRQTWIDRHVVAAGTRVLLVNPNAVRTGLNNLTRFSTAIWYELDFSAWTFRQANGRLHRIGQTRPVTILVPFYEGTAQEATMELVAKKVSASLQVDGLDIQAALEAAGAADDEREAALAAMSIGEAVYDLLSRKSA